MLRSFLRRIVRYLRSGQDLDRLQRGPKRHLDRTRVGRVIVGRRVFIGARALAMPVVTLGDDAIVAAGSVVVRDAAAGTIVAGNPAAPARRRGTRRTRPLVRARLHPSSTPSTCR
jgi:acetyltransferase-like isoleucine patch superfamily enzyme